MSTITRSLLDSYYDAINNQDLPRLLSLLADDITHDVSQGEREVGKTAFARYLERKTNRFREHIFDIEIMTNEDGSRAATEYTVLGVYLDTEEGFPVASGQTYRLPGGSFFEVEDGKISRISNHYNLRNWLMQIST